MCSEARADKLRQTHQTRLFIQQSARRLQELAIVPTRRADPTAGPRALRLCRSRAAVEDPQQRKTDIPHGSAGRTRRMGNNPGTCS